MSKYRVEYADWIGVWRVMNDAGDFVGMTDSEPQAERIARALAVLDAMDEHYAGEAAAQAASDDDVRRADQARGEG